MPVRAGGPVPADLGDAAALARCGFTGALGQTLVVPTASGPELVAVGVGAADAFDLTALRDAAAELARAVPQHYRLGVRLSDVSVLAAGAAAQAIVEGVLLARWAFTLRKKQPPRLESLVLLAAESDLAAAAEGARRGHVVADACSLSRDLANCPGGIMSAARIADVAIEVGATSGLTVEVFGKDELVEMGCGGLLGVNLGSVEPPLPWAHIDIAGTAQADAPRTWRPRGATGFGTNLLIELALKFSPVGGGSTA